VASASFLAVKPPDSFICLTKASTLMPSRNMMSFTGFRFAMRTIPEARTSKDGIQIKHS
jgi:hypothetical protein